MHFSQQYYLIFLFLIILVLTISSGSSVTYVTVYGRVDTGLVAVTTPTVSYIDCRTLCINRSTCVLSYGNTNCNLYDVGKVDSVTQLTNSTSGSEDIVTFRINKDSNTCPANFAVNPPTFDNYPATGNIVSNNVSTSYTITLTNGVWSFSTFSQNINTNCKNGQLFIRRYGIVCLRWVSRQFTASCSQYGNFTYYTGIETLDEMTYMQAAVLKWGNLYLNANVSSTCRSTGNCDNMMLGTFLIPPSRLPWLPGYPTSTGNCVALSTFDNSTFGLINLPCNSNSSEGLLYCVELPV